MRRGLRLAGLLLLCASVMPLAACDFGLVNVWIPGFDTSEVEGVSFWRDENGSFVYDGRLVFQDPVTDANGREVVDYEMVTAHGGKRFDGQAQIYRDSANPDNVSVRVYYLSVHDGPKDFKVSSYNTAGESALSADIAHF